MISKVLATRMSRVLGTIVGKEQAAFVPGRYIHNNTILTHEIIRRKGMSARCMLKVDLQKAYDSIQWSFIEDLLSALGFLRLFIRWVMECVSSVSYQICINGELTEPIEGKRFEAGRSYVSAYICCFYGVFE